VARDQSLDGFLLQRYLRSTFWNYFVL